MTPDELRQAGVSADQVRALKHIDAGPVLGPAPGWNARIWLENVCDGPELAELFHKGLIEARPIPPPHEEAHDPEAGSMTYDHVYALTDAGRAILSSMEPIND